MTSPLLSSTSGSLSFALDSLTTISPEPALMVAQVTRWLPTWLTPIWVIAAGVVLGVLACLVVYGALAILSFIPGLGSIPDSPNRGVTASLVVGLGLAAGLCWNYIDPSEKHSSSLYLPLIVLGVVTGFG